MKNEQFKELTGTLSEIRVMLEEHKVRQDMIINSEYALKDVQISIADPVIDASGIKKLWDSIPATNLVDATDSLAYCLSYERCSLPRCCRDGQCHYPDECHGPEVEEPVGVRIKARIIRQNRFGDRVSWETTGSQFGARNAVDAWTNFDRLILKSDHDYKLLLSDEGHVWWDFNGDPLHKSELWAVDLGDHYTLLRTEEESQKTFVDRALGSLNDIFLKEVYPPFPKIEGESYQSYLYRSLLELKDLRAKRAEERLQEVKFNNAGNIVGVTLLNNISFSRDAADPDAFVGMVTKVIMAIREQAGYEVIATGPMFRNTPEGHADFLIDLVRETNDDIRRERLRG